MTIFRFIYNSIVLIICLTLVGLAGYYKAEVQALSTYFQIMVCLGLFQPLIILGKTFHVLLNLEKKKQKPEEAL